jgi:hypothetical protein
MVLYIDYSVTSPHTELRAAWGKAWRLTGFSMQKSPDRRIVVADEFANRTWELEM